MNDAREKRIAELRELVLQHAGTRAATEWNLLQRAYRAYHRNANDLITLISSPHDDPRIMLEIMQEDQDSGVRDEYYDELFRFLLNYCASVSTLIDYSRNLMKVYRNSQLDFEYQNRIALLVNVEVAGFVQDLRNYLLHHRFPPLSISMHFSNQPKDMAFAVTLNSQRMLEWKGWKSKGKSYIRNHDPLVLRQSVEEYSNTVSELYDWLFAQFHIVHANDIREVETLQAEARDLLGLPDTP